MHVPLRSSSSGNRPRNAWLPRLPSCVSESKSLGRSSSCARPGMCTRATMDADAQQAPSVLSMLTVPPN